MSNQNFDIMSMDSIRIGVVADTHVPDRVGALHPDIISTFKELKVQLIIHAGDISSPEIIIQLKEVAPVEFVQGNRDWWRFKNLPAEKIIGVNEVKIMITHGHGHLLSYFWDKFPYFLLGYRFERFLKKFSKYKDNFDIIVFGHSHHAENRWVDGKLYFNPGSAYDPGTDNQRPSIGLIEIDKTKKVEGKIIKLRALIWQRGGWINPK